MGFTSSPQLLSHYHQAAETILWHNSNILIAGKHIEPKHSSFKNISNKLYFIADLYSNFNSANYPQNPSFLRGIILSPDLLSARFNTQTTQCEWTNIIDQARTQQDMHNLLCNGHDYLHPTLY